MLTLCLQSLSLVLPLTSAILGLDSIAVVPSSTALAVGPGCVGPAVLTVARHIVALINNQVGVRVAIALAAPARAAHHHGVAIVTRGTPGVEGRSVRFDLGDVEMETKNTHSESSVEVLEILLVSHQFLRSKVLSRTLRHF